MSATPPVAATMGRNAVGDRRRVDARDRRHGGIGELPVEVLRDGRHQVVTHELLGARIG